jgi:hypothetical protein
MDKVTSLIHKVEEMIADLSKPLSASDISGGWVEGSRLQWLDFFTKLRERLVNRQPLEGDNYLHLIRAMDNCGISEGPLLNKALEIRGELKDYSPQR